MEENENREDMVNREAGRCINREDKKKWVEDRRQVNSIVLQFGHERRYSINQVGYREGTVKEIIRYRVAAGL